MTAAELDTTAWSLRLDSPEACPEWLGFGGGQWARPGFVLERLGPPERMALLACAGAVQADGKTRSVALRFAGAAGHQTLVLLRLGRPAADRPAGVLACGLLLDPAESSEEELEPRVADPAACRFTLDPEGRFTGIDGRQPRFPAASAAHLAGRSAFAVLDDARWLREPLRQALAGRSVVARGHQGSREWRVELSPRTGATGEVQEVVGTVFEVGARARAEQRLRAHQAVTRILAGARDFAEAAPKVVATLATTLDWKVACLWTLDRQALALRCEHVWHAGSLRTHELERRSLGVAFARGVGLAGTVWATGGPLWISHFPQSNLPRSLMAAADGLQTALGVPVVASGEVVSVIEFFDTEHRLLDQPLLRMASSVASQLGLFVERERARTESRLNGRRFDVMMQSAVDGIVAMDEQGRILEFNPAAEQLFGVTRDKILGSRLDELVPRLASAPARSPAAPAEQPRLEPGARMEMTVRRNDGPELPVEVGVVPVQGHSRPEFIAFVRDISERKRAESELAFRASLLEAMCEGSPEGILVVSVERKILFFNQRFVEMWRLDEQSLDSHDDGAALAGSMPLIADPEGFLARIEWLYAHPDAEVMDEYLLRDGRTVERYSTSVRAGGQIYGRVWYFRDVTDRKRAEQRERLFAHEEVLRASTEEARWRLAFLARAGSVLAASLDYGHVVGLAGHVALPELADWCVLDMVGEGGELRRMSVAHADPRYEALVTELSRQPPPDAGAAGIPAVRRSGQPALFGEVPDAALADPQRSPFGAVDARQLHLIRGLGAHSCLVLPLLTRDRVLGVLTLVFSEPGRRYANGDLDLGRELAYRLASAIEHARLYQDARESIQARDEFLSVASHELRSPMSSLQLAVQGTLRQLRLRRQLSPERLERSLLTADRQAQRLVRLVDTLLDASRIRAGRLDLQLAPVNLSLLVREVAALHEAELRACGSRLLLEVPESLVGTWDRARLEQVLTNLLSNATKYGEGRSRWR